MAAKFLLPFLFSFLLSIIAIFFLLRTPFLRPNLKKRLGGLVVIVIFILFVLYDKDLVITKPIAGIITGGLLILIFGLWDDIKNLNWKWQLAFQVIIAITAILFGVRSGYTANPFGGTINLENPAVYIFIYTLYFLLFINALNWLDGIDGLSGSVTFVALAEIFFLSLLPHVNQPAAAILCATAAGAVLAFLVFNWHPAKIIAGTSGAWFFGFLLASLSIFAGAKIATVFMVTLIPVLDLVSVIWERHHAGGSIFSGGDSRHLHHKLLKLGLGEKQIVVLVCVFGMIVGLAALNLNAIGKMVFIAIFSAAYFILQRIKFKI
ncbi:MAG: glycosyl transferase, family 4, conserved region, UDP-N-acetylglucosamine:undecaprenyl-P N-acetylglucosaminyl 1-P transferase [Candidatus Moranbacteria bacterium GW2011_GWC1_45_18]|nr:MAG: Glycosyl transferase, family 4 [Candidatus Moranbacteria bacterium GW2011_GWC2_40_12]KKT33940.1 MAG: Glycosyl transferase, family 4 [Candidatus Moranbacteria bacterium GW2011_GWF2_44_10]KKT70326.1 MAG: Glycosyl transferase, family 4 [Candidatus Moranbacteria bacterium GW2011_GWF1_44_4]KKT99838.1 MAG: glycosyl transferase, family 4, conserved region, UDP-N-acetylglucosamine:undecaprenyl-P N-acetylglucosaminyl 1-P transferase [Candidatus Moranbacteria bacterium GW2011_GWC1_45_18]OGI43074.